MVNSPVESGPGGESKVCFITDAEGNLDYFQRCVALSTVVCSGEDGALSFSREEGQDIFVYGGDTCDKGDGDIRIVQALVAFKGKHPDRVHLLVGNRDLNKIRVSAELRETDIDVPLPVPAYPGMDKQVTLWEYLVRLNSGKEEGLEALNTRANRLRWMLDCTLGAKGQFESRRKELACMRARNVTDEEVVQSYVDAVEQDDGFLWQYFEHAEMAFRWGNTLFVHGGLPARSPGWLPPLRLPYVTPAEGAECPGEDLPEGHTLEEWIEAMNARFREGLRDYRAGLTWQEGRRRGGEMLLAWQSNPACYQRSVVVESALTMGTPSDVPEAVSRYLLERGVSRLVTGHKPCGDSPFAVRGGGLELLLCDTTYSDSSAPDGRGLALAAVEIVGSPPCNRSTLRGRLRDGSAYDFALPLLGESVAEDPCGDARVGRRTSDGWWVKAVLGDGRYHCARSLPGDRRVSYCLLTTEELSSRM